MGLKNLFDLTEREILAIAIAAEEEDSRIYSSFAEDLAGRYPGTAKVFREMAAEEDDHRCALFEIHRERFGQSLPPIRPEDVRGFPSRRPNWVMRNLPLDAIRRYAETMEMDSQRFFAKAAAATQDIDVRKLLGDLALVEKRHCAKTKALAEAILTESVREAEGRTAHRFFVLQYVQPGLAGLMDGSVATLAPLFAAAFATHNNWNTLLIGLAASIGAGISMGIAEALSDDGAVTGRGEASIRGAVCGLMTLLGGLGHSLPYLIPGDWPNAFWTATYIAAAVVLAELLAIAYIRARYMDTPFFKAMAQIVVGGAIVLGVGVLIGAG